MVKKQMQQEVEKLGLAPYSCGAQDEYERGDGYLTEKH